MPVPSTTATTCPRCGASYPVEPLTFRGKQFIPAGLCEPCAETEDRQHQLEAIRADWIDRRNRSGLPRQLHGLTIPESPAGQTTRRWAHGKIQVLTLTGLTGVGKTHLAAAATWAAWTRRPVRWISVASAMAKLKAGFGDDDRRHALAALTGSDSVVLDDLDKLPVTSSGLSTIFAAIDSRIQSGAPLLVTTNVTLDQLAAKLAGGRDKSSDDRQTGQAIASRLAGGTVLKLTGPDRRLGR